MSETAYRQIDVAQRENGYDQVKSEVIESKNEFDAFRKKIEGMEFWNEKQKFLAKLNAAKIDFAKEALVLLRHTEGSGSNSVQFKQAKLDKSKLVCVIERKSPPPGTMGTADMAYYCYLLVVNKEQVKEVELQVSGKPPLILSIQN